MASSLSTEVFSVETTQSAPSESLDLTEVAPINLREHLRLGAFASIIGFHQLKSGQTTKFLAWR